MDGWDDNDAGNLRIGREAFILCMGALEDCMISMGRFWSKFEYFTIHVQAFVASRHHN